MTRQDKVMKFCQLVVCKGPKAFEVFLDALKENGQNFIADKLSEGMPTTR